MLAAITLILLFACLLGVIQHDAKTIERRPLDWFKPSERELARHSDQDEIRRRGEDMLANGQLQAVGVTEDGRLIFGHGRFLSAKAVGIKVLEVKLFPSSLTDTQFHLIRAGENLQRKDLTGYEKWVLCVDLLSGNSDWTQGTLAKNLHLSESMIVRYVSPSRCSAAWQQALKDGLVGISDCYAASPLDEHQQAELLKLKLSGASRDTITTASRRVRNGNGQPAVKVAKVKCCLPGGIQIVLSGQEMSLDEAIEALAEGLKAAKKAQSDGLDAKTWSAVMRDKAKAN